MLEAQRVVSWNYRGAASREFAVEMKNMMRELRTKMIIIIDPKVSGAVTDRVCRDLGKKRWIRAEARGFSRGIWVMWEEGDIEAAHMSFLHMGIRLMNGEWWAMTAVYESPHAGV